MPGDNEVEALRRRLRRLEALVALLVIEPEGLPSPFMEEFFYRMFRRDELPDDEFWNELRHFMLRGPYLGRWRSLEERLNALEASWQRTSELAESLPSWQERTQTRLSSLEAEHRVLQEDSHRWLILQSLGIELRDAPVPRFVQVRVHLAEIDPQVTDAVSNAVQLLLNALKFGVADDFPAREGSWFKEWFAKSEEPLSLSELQDKLAKIERALEHKEAKKSRPQIDKAEAKAVATLLASIPKNSDVAMQIGSLLILHIANDDGGVGCTQVRSLSEQELILIEKNPKLLASPRDVMHQLAELLSKAAGSAQ